MNKFWKKHDEPIWTVLREPRYKITHYQGDKSYSDHREGKPLKAFCSRFASPLRKTWTGEGRVRRLAAEGEIGLFMPARSKIDLDKIRASLNTVCPHCNAILPPSEQHRIDWEQMKCPHCGETFIPPTKQGG